MKEYTHPEYPDSEFRAIDMQEMSNGDLVVLVAIESDEPTLNVKPWLFRVSSTDCFQGQEVCDDIPSGTVESQVENAISGIHVYPNPAQDQVVIESRNGNKLSEVRLFNMDGRLLHQKSIRTREFLLDVSHLSINGYLFAASTG